MFPSSEATAAAAQVGALAAGLVRSLGGRCGGGKVGALRPPGGAEPRRRRRGEWRRLRRCGVALWPWAPGLLALGSERGLGLREEGAGRPGPRLPRRLALGGWRRPWAPRSRSLSRGRGRGGPVRPPLSPSWVAGAPGRGPHCPGAGLRLSLPSGEPES